MSEHKEPIPSMLYNASVGGHVTNSQQIIDENENKEQSQINAEVKQNLGQGGSVDSRINQAKTDIIGGASFNGNTLKKIEDRVLPLENAVGAGGNIDSRISSAVLIEATRAQAAEENLRQLYNNLQQSQPIPVTALPAIGEAGKIYRLAGITSYADYMYSENDLTTPIKMAEYDNAIDNEPISGSDNLVKSSGIKYELNKIIPLHMTCSVGHNVVRYDFINNHSYVIQNNTAQSIHVQVGDNENLDHKQIIGNVGANTSVEFIVDNNYTYKYLYIYSNETNIDAVVLYNKNYYVEEIEKLSEKVNELDSVKLDISAIKVSILSNNIFDAAHNLLTDTVVSNDGDIATVSGWKVAKIDVVPGQVITFGRFSLLRSGYYAFYNDTPSISSLISVAEFADPDGGVAATVTVPSEAIFLCIDIVSPATIGGDSPLFTACYGTVLLPYDEYKKAVTEILSAPIAGDSVTGLSINDLLVDLPVSDGTNIEIGYAYIDSTTNVIKVKR